MRKYIKARILELLQSVTMGLEELAEVSPTEAVEILTEAQSAVISIGNIIEEKEPEKREELIPCLEEFAEAAYRLAVDILEGRETSMGCQNLLEEGRAIQTLLECKLEVIYEIVFLPYKVSMWDCMESVYYAALLHENCNISVVPIPYCNLSQNGDILETIYEGKAFPEQVKILSFEEYDVAEVCPDVIFIHNPYDEYNYVTQVPSRYFSRELVKYTNHLVYLPYKVCHGVVNDVYCALPGVKYSWRVFVQSESVRETYIKYNNPDKIIALGSPKVDKVIASGKQKPNMPDDWKRVFQDRKVFLFNTHLNNIINNGEAMIEKLRLVFNLFRDQPDIAILWRPHPLSIQTAKSMNPRILPSYLGLIDEFRTLENGIYDESADMHKAIFFSDAYIGDGSSLVSLYGVTGKPLMILCLMRGAVGLMERNMDSIRMASAVFSENKIYFCARDSKGLYTYDTEKGRTEYIGRLNEDVHSTIGMVDHVSKYKNKLFLTGGKVKECHAVYCLEDGRNYVICKSVSVRPREEVKNCLRYGERIYLIYSDFHSFGYINMESEEYVDLTPQIRNTIQNLGFQNKDMQIIDSVLAGNELVFLCKNNTVIVYDTETSFFKQFRADIGAGELLRVEKEEELFYFLSSEMEIFQYDENKGCIARLKIAVNCEVSNGIGRIVVHRELVWLIPSKNGIFYSVDFRKNRVSSLEYSKEAVFDYDLFAAIDNFCCLDKVGNELLLYPRAANRLMIINMEKHKLEEKQVKVPESISEKEFEYHMLERGGCTEWFQSVYSEKSCSIQEFIDRVRNEKDIKQKNRRQEFSRIFANTQGNCGTEIWNYIMDRI